MKVYNLPKDVKPSEPASWCQEVGWVEAKPACKLLPGEKRVYNYGVTYLIRSVVIPAPGKWVLIEVQAADGKIYTSKSKPNTLIPFEK